MVQELTRDGRPATMVMIMPCFAGCLQKLVAACSSSSSSASQSDVIPLATPQPGSSSNARQLSPETPRRQTSPEYVT